MIVVEILFAATAVYVAVLSGYLALTTLGAVLLRKRVETRAESLKLAVVIPAHNEQLQIRPAVERVLESCYPRDRFAVFVIADNCDDATAAQARKAGAQAFERTDPDLRGKGQALHWFLTTHAELLASFDGIALVDADTEVDPWFLAEISASLSHPDVAVVQGYHGVSNPDDHWRTVLAWAGFALVNGLRPAGRCHWGGTADLKGNGMAFRADLLLRYGWPAHSIVEDLEFTLHLLLDGVRVWFNPDAVVLSEMPVTRRQAEPQRRRWEGGRLQIARAYLPVLVRTFLARPRWRYLDAILELLTPPLSVLLLVEAACALAAVLLRPEWGVVFLGGLVVAILYVVGGLCLRRAPRSVWLGLMAAPLFMLWKLGFYLRLVRDRKPATWERTQRRAEQNPQPPP